MFPSYPQILSGIRGGGKEGCPEGTHVPPINISMSLKPSTQESEVQLLENAKRFTEQIQQQQVCLQQAEDFPNVFTTEVCKLREQLLKYQNEYTAAQEREYNIQYRLTR